MNIFKNGGTICFKSAVYLDKLARIKEMKTYFNRNITGKAFPISILSMGFI